MADSETQLNVAPFRPLVDRRAPPRGNGLTSRRVRVHGSTPHGRPSARFCTASSSTPLTLNIRRSILFHLSAPGGTPGPRYRCRHRGPHPLPNRATRGTGSPGVTQGASAAGAQREQGTPRPGGRVRRWSSRFRSGVSHTMSAPTRRHLFEKSRTAAARGPVAGGPVPAAAPPAPIRCRARMCTDRRDAYAAERARRPRGAGVHRGVSGSEPAGTAMRCRDLDASRGKFFAGRRARWCGRSGGNAARVRLVCVVSPCESSRERRIPECIACSPRPQARGSRIRQEFSLRAAARSGFSLPRSHRTCRRLLQFNRRECDG